jgi:hypothetical protein
MPYFFQDVLEDFKRVKVEVVQLHFEVFQKLRPIAHLLRRMMMGNRQNEVFQLQI